MYRLLEDKKTGLLITIISTILVTAATGLTTMLIEEWKEKRKKRLSSKEKSGNKGRSKK